MQEAWICKQGLPAGLTTSLQYANYHYPDASSSAPTRIACAVGSAVCGEWPWAFSAVVGDSAGDDKQLQMDSDWLPIHLPVRIFFRAVANTVKSPAVPAPQYCNPTEADGISDEPNHRWLMCNPVGSRQPLGAGHTWRNTCRKALLTNPCCIHSCALVLPVAQVDH